jgi:hypothetical protein
MNGESGHGAEAFPPLRTVCPTSASQASVYTASLVAIYGLQAVFILLLLLLGAGWTTAFSGATELLLVDLVAAGGQTGLRQLAARWPFISPHGLV